MTDKPNPRMDRSDLHAPDHANHDTHPAEDPATNIRSGDPNAASDPNETVAIAPDAGFDPYSTDDSRGLVTPGIETSEANPLNVSTIVPDPVSTRDLDNRPPKSNAVRRSSITDQDSGQTIELADVAGDSRLPVPVKDRPAVAPPAGYRSVLSDANVAQTVNPRELSPEDAALWGTLCGASAEVEPSRQSPAINRSLSETKLVLRGQVIADTRSEMAKQADYRLVRLLGKGGMGNVYSARQGSLDRNVALKVIRPLEEEKKQRFKDKGVLEQVEQERRLQFISEAVVTGDLDHPNIVPIHDIAVTGDNTLFYSMKRVSGTPWSKVIHEKTALENIDILLKVCDAIGFAHKRGVVHRDIKPENIMVDDFGVVMVMDWGLALAKPEFDKLDSVHHTTGLGGSPAYMAPEMATGPIERIGPASDIYLLGATLFQIITSFAPHQAANVRECLKVVAANQIREVPPEHHGELLEIALKAMATRPEDRFADVQALQEAIRNYRSHSESIRLASDAQLDLELATKSSSYERYSRAVFGYEEALKLWKGNRKAQLGLAAARLQYAEGARRKGDFDLGLSLLDRDDAEHQALIEQLERGKRDRTARGTRLAVLRKVAAAMLAIIIIGGGAAVYAINHRSLAALQAQRQAESHARQAEDSARQALASAKSESEQKTVALQKTIEANAAKAVAEIERKKAVDAAKAETIAKQAAIDSLGIAVEAEKIAKKERRIADQARMDADRARSAAEYEKYVSQIGLAKARIDESEFADARQILQNLRRSAGSEGPAWEWRWLWRQTTQSLSTLDVLSPARLFDLSRSSGSIASVLDDGRVQMARLERDGQLASFGPPLKLISDDTSTIVFSPDHRSIVVGTRSGDIEIWNLALSDRSASWTAHNAAINRLHFIDDQTLVSASDDHSLRIWNMTDQSQLSACWNLGPVKDFSVSAAGDQHTLVAAIAERTSGRATVWKLIRNQSKWQSELVGEFLEHQRPVLCIALSPDSLEATSGDSSGRLFVWNIADVAVTNYADDVGNAISQLSSLEPPASNVFKSKYKPLIDSEDLHADAAREFAHRDRIRVVRYSADGKTILSGGDDYSIRLWDAHTAQHIKTLKGHGGWILDARFADDSGDLIVSSSADETLRTWRPKTYTQASVSTQLRVENDGALHGEEILSARLNVAGDAIVTASQDRTAIVSNIHPQSMTISQVAELKDDLDAVTLKEGTPFVAQSFALDREHSLLYVASADAIVRVWDMDRGNERFQMDSVGLNASLALSRDGHYLLTRAGSKDAKSLLWRVDPSGNQTPRLVFQYGGHAEKLAVTALAISADGSRLFTADSGGIGILWDGRTGKQIGAKFEMLRGYRINAAEFSVDGSELFVAADDQQLTRIDVNSRAIRSRLGHSGFVTNLSLADEHRFALTISEQTTVSESRMLATVWNLATGASQVIDRSVSPLKRDDRVNQKRERITAVQFGPNGKSMAVAKQTSSDGSGRIVIWALDDAGKATPTDAFEFPAVVGTPQACIPLPNDRMLTLNGDAAFQWKLNAEGSKTASHLISYRANAAVHHANFSSDGKFVITASHSVKVWDVAKQRSMVKLELPHQGPLTCAEFTPRAGSYQFATSGADGKLKLWEFDPKLSQTSLLATWFAEESLPPIRRVRFSPDGGRLLVVGDKGIIRIVSLDGNREVLDYSSPDAGNVTAGAFSADGMMILVGGEDATARLWRTPPAGTADELPVIFKGHADRIEDVKFLGPAASPLRILTASRDKSVRVWDPRLGSDDRLGREILQLPQHTQGATSVDANADGSLVISAGRDAKLVLWPAATLPLE